MSEQEDQTPIEFPPPPPTDDVAFAPPDVAPEPTRTEDPGLEPTPSSAPTAVAVAPQDSSRPASQTLAEAVAGIALPCDLAPLMGTGPVDPRDVAFFTTGHDAATVGFALSDEFERLGFVLTPIDDRTIRAECGPDLIRARLISSVLTSEDVMRELHPSAPQDALVVEMKLA